MVIPKCRVCKSIDWVEAWAGVLRCIWCGALMSLRTGTVVKCADLRRPVVKAEAYEVVNVELFVNPRLINAESESVSVGLERPEGWH